MTLEPLLAGSSWPSWPKASQQFGSAGRSEQPLNRRVVMRRDGGDVACMHSIKAAVLVLKRYLSLSFIAQQRWKE